VGAYLGIDIDSPGVQTHLTTLQSIIGRLSTLGGGVKMLAATVVGLVAVLGDGDWGTAGALAGFVLVLWGLDGYYLAKERSFRHAYNCFVYDLQSEQVLARDLFRIEKPVLKTVDWVKATLSPAVWIFYSAIIILTFAVIGAWGC
jgi:hypothetical protein